MVVCMRACMHTCSCACLRVRVCVHGYMCVCACACLRVREYACARACLWLYVCVGACMCVYICVRAELCTCMRVCVRARTCVNARACTFSHVCVLLCVHLCTQVCVHVCVRLQGCVNADVRTCGGGCMHICVKSVRVSFLVLRHLPGNLQWVGLHELLILKPWCSWCCCFWTPCCWTTGCCWIITDFLLCGTWLFNTTRTIVKYCPDAGLWIFVVSKASGRSLFDHLFRPYIYVFIWKIRIYTYYTAYTPAKIHIRCIEYGEFFFIHMYIYTYRIYTVCIYTVRIYGVYILIPFGPTLMICD